jgi:hypothetical protein
VHSGRSRHRIWVCPVLIFFAARIPRLALNFSAPFRFSAPQDFLLVLASPTRVCVSPPTIMSPGPRRPDFLHRISSRSEIGSLAFVASGLITASHRGLWLSLCSRPYSSGMGLDLALSTDGFRSLVQFVFCRRRSSLLEGFGRHRLCHLRWMFCGCHTWFQFWAGSEAGVVAPSLAR